MTSGAPASTRPEPLGRVLRLPEAAAFTGLSRATLWRLLDAGKFPKPIALTEGRRPTRGWLLEELDAWIDQRKAARDLKPDDDAEATASADTSRRPGRPRKAKGAL